MDLTGTGTRWIGVLVLVAKEMRKLVMRSERYYEDIADAEELEAEPEDAS